MLAEPTMLDALTLRGATMDDLERAVELFNLGSLEMLGTREFSVEDIGQEWETPNFDPARDICLAETASGQLVGYVEVWTLSNPPVHPWVWGRTHPAFRDQGIGTRLLEWAEARARDEMRRVPDGARVAMTCGTLSQWEAGHRLLRDYGMTEIRHSWRMAVDLHDEPPAVEWPEGIALRTYNEVPDGLKIYRAVDEAFQDHWGHIPQPEAEGFARWSHFVFDENFDPSLCLLAMDGDEIAGTALCRHHLSEDPEMGWVNTLGVRRPWRKRGLGLALLRQAFRELWQRGQRRVGLGVDAGSLTGATRLYERAGMRVTRQLAFYEKELRPGEELAKQAVEQ